MRSTSKIQFYARESKKDKNGLVHIEVSVIQNGERCFCNLPFQVEPQKFNSKRRPKEYEDYIAQMRVRINQILVEMAARQEPLTAKKLRDYIKQGGYKSYTVNDMFDDYLSILAKRKLSNGVYRKYELVKELYLEENDGEKEVNSITPYTISQFQNKLYSKYQSSTAAGYLTKMKTMVIFARDNGHLKINPFNGIKITKENKPIEYLTQDEVEMLANLELENESLQNVLDCFLFQCSSGLSYADMLSLKREDVQDDGNGHYFINKKRVKTGSEYCAVILPLGIRVLEKHNYKLNVISNQKMNSYLHIVEKQIGFKKSLHTHLARHTYCTTLLNNNIRLETVSKMAGHKNTKITQTFYAFLENDTVINEVSKAFNI